MSETNTSSYYTGAFIGGLIGGLLMLFFPFGGWYNNFGGTEVWENYYFWYDISSVLLILPTALGLLYVAYGSYQAMNTPPTALELDRMFKISLAALSIVVIGWIAFEILASENDDWWVDTGFYGGLIGSIISTLLLKSAKSATK